MGEEHPLPRVWDLYAHTLADTKTYSGAYTNIGTLRTFEDWGRMYNHLPGADVFADPRHGLIFKLPDPVTKALVPTRIVAYSLFHEGVKPEWEDPANLYGTTLSARLTLTLEKARDAWNSLFMNCVRGAMDDGVLGVQVSDKAGGVVKFDIWLEKDTDAARIARFATASTSIKFQVTSRGGGNGGKR